MTKRQGYYSFHIINFEQLYHVQQYRKELTSSELVVCRRQCHLPTALYAIGTVPLGTMLLVLRDLSVKPMEHGLLMILAVKVSRLDVDVIVFFKN